MRHWRDNQHTPQCQMDPVDTTTAQFKSCIPPPPLHRVPMGFFIQQMVTITIRTLIQKPQFSHFQPLASLIETKERCTSLSRCGPPVLRNGIIRLGRRHMTKQGGGKWHAMSSSALPSSPRLCSPLCCRGRAPFPFAIRGGSTCQFLLLRYPSCPR